MIVVVNQGDETVGAFRLDARTGGLLPATAATQPTDANPYAIAADPNGRWFWVTHGDASDVVIFRRDLVSNVIERAAAAPVATGEYAVGASIDPSGRFLYVMTMVADAVAAFAIGDGGTLTPVEGSPFAAGGRPSGGAVDPRGRHFYATIANNGSATISAYRIDARSGALSELPGSPYAAGKGPFGIAVF